VVRASSTWIGTKGRRFTTIVFVLPRGARVVFTISRLFPTCTPVGHFTVAGHAGVNRFRFAGKLHGRPLPPGTYRIALRTAAGGPVRRVTIVVVENGVVPTKTQVATARASNACAARGELSTGADIDTTERGGVASAIAVGRSASPAVGHPFGAHSGVLASTAERAARAARPVLLALLALSILLLGLASLPQPAVPDARLNDLLTRHRLEIAGAGVAALIGVALAFVLG
jgi:hypothetical protein